jgi:hypothetical protein
MHHDEPLPSRLHRSLTIDVSERLNGVSASLGLSDSPLKIDSIRN